MSWCADFEFRVTCRISGFTSGFLSPRMVSGRRGWRAAAGTDARSGRALCKGGGGGNGGGSVQGDGAVSARQLPARPDSPSPPRRGRSALPRIESTNTVRSSVRLATCSAPSV